MREENVGGRPTLKEQNIERIEVQIHLTLYRGEDDDLIDWFNSVPRRKRAQNVKKALRQGGTTEVETHEFAEEFISDDLLDELLGAL